MKTYPPMSDEAWRSALCYEHLVEDNVIEGDVIPAKDHSYAWVTVRVRVPHPHRSDQ